MKFQRLKLHGFKSFCDATDLVLEPGLTGVVGPNGCGKSNLVEALRWVMGESSHKAMRASGMDEVIFSGSANRPGRNTAQVSLVLDNTDRTAPAPLNHADILEITRRIERDSGSNYRVNGREVRARDVQLLFADASTGAHSPALVRQGQIGELIAAKPVQRRALLEEAAGISGLHSRRHEAELRLRAADQNLERIDDIIGQIEQQLDGLKRQARQATRYRNLSGDIRRAEATLFHLRWVASRVAEKEAEAQQGKLISALADATHTESETGKAVESAEDKLQPLRDKEAVAGAVLQRLKIMADQLDDEMRRANQQRAELTDRARQITGDREREATLIADAEAAIAASDNELQALATEAAGAEDALEKARADAGDLKSGLDAAEALAREAADALSALRARRGQAERSLADAEQRAARLKGQIGDVEAEAARVVTALEADETVAAKQQALGEAEARRDAAEAAAVAAEKTTGERQAALDAARPQFAEVETELGRLESEAATLARVLHVGDGNLWPAVVDSLRVVAGYETALGAALGDDLDASSDSGAPIHWAATGDGSGDPALPAGARPLAEFVSGVPGLVRRLRQIGLVDKADGMRLVTRLHPGQRLVTREGDLWRWDGLVAAADAPTPAAQRLAQRNRLGELDAEIGAAKARRLELKSTIDEMSAGLDMARQEERTARETWRTAQHDISAARSALDIAQKALGDLSKRQSALDEARTQMSHALAEAETAATEARSLLVDAGGEAEAEGLAATRRSDADGLRETYEQARLTLGGFENAARLRDARSQQLTQDGDAWRRRKSGAEAQLATLGERAEQIAQQISALEATPDAMAARRGELADEIAAAETAHKAASDTLAVAQTESREADRAARLAHDAVSGVREELARVEERLKGIIGQRQQIEQLCQETLSVAASRTAEVAGLKPEAPLPREEDTERRVERLKAERERLGGVNLAAEREAEEVKEKLDTMVADREDLIAAIAKLRTGISSLNREGRARLTEAFDKVNGHFRELFTTLFGGGTAELSFVESDDPLEAGLEIIARPPGKKPQTMTLLSGGEQALTALSLIFAVFLTNPAPICVLDEVDAPLDDANVERFCTLLDSMRQRTDTRFVVITHNPITMSRVDRLFGVTMAERGVSQLVSVDLTTAQAVAEAV